MKATTPKKPVLKKPIRVWFYSDARLNTERRTAAFAPRCQVDELVSIIANCMEMNERFACFKTLDGRIVAMSRTGEFVMV